MINFLNLWGVFLPWQICMILRCAMLLYKSYLAVLPG